MDQFINIINGPNGSEQVQFIDSRYYTRDKVNWYPGVTAILSIKSKGSQYDNWLKSNGFNADYLAKKAMEQGSNVHQAIQFLLQGKEISYGSALGANYTRDEWIMISRFIDFYTEFKPETVAVEEVLVSDKLQFGTQLDYVCKLNGELLYVDHKTGSLYSSASMQIAASIQLWNEHHPETPITRGAVLHLDSAHRGRDKTGKKMQGLGWQLVEIDNIQGHWEDFEHLHAIWKRDNPNYRPFNSIYPASYKL